MNLNYKLLSGVAIVVFLFDQASKWIVTQTIPDYRTIKVIDGCFDLVNVRNRGAAFGFLNRSDIEWQFWLFLIATVVAVLAIFAAVHNLKKKSTLLVAGLGSILGGALGNLLDRLRFRAVIDFLDFYWHDWHWPAFNIADAGICIGACLVCLALFLEKKTASDSN